MEIEYTRPTGDPFIDVGGYVIENLGRRFPDKNIYQHIEYATDIYVKYWGGKLHTYFLNSSITQPAFNTEKKISETLKYYKSLLEETNPDFKIGFCRILGIESRLYVAGRSNHMMSASGAFLNFHSAYENGLYLSKEALIRTFFIPLGVSFVGDKIALLQSNYDNVNSFLVEKNLAENLENVKTGNAEGTLKSECGIVSNALFNYADYCISNLAVIEYNNDNYESLKDVQLNMYHFTNFGASPDIKLHTFSNLLFKFYAHCKKHYLKEWDNFINQHYKYSKFKEAQFDDQSEEWYNKKERVSHKEYKIWNNPILNKLLDETPIISHLCRWSKKHKFSFNIVEIYCINILKMEKYTIQKIKELADFILNDKSDDQIKGSIVKLNGLKKPDQFRDILLKLIKDNYVAKNPNPLITIEDFVFFLVPDSQNWKETRDLLLIAVYQQLHEMEKQISDIPDEKDNSEEIE